MPASKPKKTWHLFPLFLCFPAETEETRQTFLKGLYLFGDWLDVQCTNIPACLIKGKKLLLFKNDLLKQKKYLEYNQLFPCVPVLFLPRTQADDVSTALFSVLCWLPR